MTAQQQEALAVLSADDADYQRLNLARDAVAPWEDGARTDNRRGTYEWWYFEAHLDDGAKLVVVFMNKNLATPNDPLTPTIRINLELADGRSLQKLATYPPESWQATTSRADVRIGEHRFSGDLHTYRIRLASTRSPSRSPWSARCPPGDRRPATCCSAPSGTRSSPGCHRFPKAR